MKIESGKYYRTRSNKKAYVAAVGNPFYETGWPAVGFTEDGDCVEEWQISGYWSQPEDPNERDLIAEWKEPITVSGWICLYEDGVFFHTVKPNKNHRLIAMREVQVNLTEGEGLQ